jgi:hypothetical protein
MDTNAITAAIIGCAMRVGNTLGVGYLEKSMRTPCSRLESKFAGVSDQLCLPDGARSATLRSRSFVEQVIVGLKVLTIDQMNQV